MVYPPLRMYDSIADYRVHFEKVYCRKPIATFDGIAVRFKKGDFYHCFFESSRRDGSKDDFSQQRAQRIDWIKSALQDSGSERYVGWDKKKKRYDRRRRVVVVMGNYVVVIVLTGQAKADFITAYLADTPGTPGRPSTLEMIRRSPRWE